MNAGLLELWRVWDFFYQHITRLEYVDKENENIFRIVFCKYHGPTLVTRDGVEIKRGDKIVKLHIHNWKLSKKLKGINNEARLGLMTLKLVKNSMPNLALYINAHEKGKDVKAIVGTTFLHRGVNRLGFDVAPVPNHVLYRIKNQYLKFMLYLIHPNGLKRLNQRKDELKIKRVFMSKQSLTNRYSTDQELEDKA